MSSATGNIFLTTENLAFSLPLIAVCGVYAYFKFIPLNIGLPILGGLFLLHQIRAQLKHQRNKRLQNMDENAINDLALQLEQDEDKSSDANDAAAKQMAKKKAAIQRRLAAEAKKESKQQGRKNKSQDDDDEVNLDAFAKAGNKKKN